MNPEIDKLNERQLLQVLAKLVFLENTVNFFEFPNPAVFYRTDYHDLRYKMVSAIPSDTRLKLALAISQKINELYPADKPIVLNLGNSSNSKIAHAEYINSLEAVFYSITAGDFTMEKLKRFERARQKFIQTRGRQND